MVHTNRINDLESVPTGAAEFEGRSNEYVEAGGPGYDGAGIWKFDLRRVLPQKPSELHAPDGRLQHHGRQLSWDRSVAGGRWSTFDVSQVGGEAPSSPGRRAFHSLEDAPTTKSTPWAISWQRYLGVGTQGGQSKICSRPSAASRIDVG
jgi:hypothetical protein